MKRFWLIGLLLLVLVGLSRQAFAAEGEEVADSASDQLISATILSVDDIPTDDGTVTHTYSVQLTSGPEKGRTVIIGDNESVPTLGGTVYEVGDRVLVSTIDHIDQTERFVINDYERRPALWWIVGIFAGVVIWFSRWRGVRSLVGLALTYVVILYWIVPRLANGASPVLTAVIGGSVILLVTLLVTEGWHRSTWAAAITMVVAMGVTLGLSYWAVSLAG